ncbi:translesion DNA synthesis-associated protein ImuA [Paraburkholderia sp. CNPSo 3157]|uniref:Translesion DNA synthesis-associated protein ImuA n=2 Tax=Paraburkholderia franconis TaxID=2654983 RepID=A0A7X1TGA0_9BURK|nr:translesion DNA synthesis-associated protein ImuA [Paraburkholderia franconis]
MNAQAPLPESVHPSLWRASQLARGRLFTVETAYPALSHELPGGGWPVGALVEILAQHPGSAEMRLVAPALGALDRPIALVEPPCDPSIQGLAYAGFAPGQLMLVRAKSTSDQLWSTEQILKAGTCGAVLLWQTHARADALRRLLLAARSSTSLFFVFRPVHARTDASPAELRIAVRSAEEGVFVEIVKRKGPRFEGELTVTVRPGSMLTSPHGRARSAIRPIDIDARATGDAFA